MSKHLMTSKHQLLVDRAVTQDYKTRLINLCTAWNDYKKACYSMRHTSILNPKNYTRLTEEPSSGIRWGCAKQH